MVSSSSEDWRAECEAASLLAMRLSDRQRYLEVVQKKRGQAERDALERRSFAVQLDRDAGRVLEAQSLGERRQLLEQVGYERGAYARRELETEVSRRWQQRAA